jgi:nitrogen fixation/metabolism regulation signal transduction histidine kinase
MSVQQAADRVQIGVSPASEERRKSHRSDPSFQNRYRLALMQLVLLALIPTVALSLLVNHAVQHPEVLLDSPWVPLATAVLTVAAWVWILRRCTKVSNRYCGPTYRLMQAVEAIRRGERVKPVGVRKDDEFEQLVQLLNATFIQLGVMDEDLS